MPPIVEGAVVVQHVPPGQLDLTEYPPLSAPIAPHLAPSTDTLNLISQQMSPPPHRQCPQQLDSV